MKNKWPDIAGRLEGDTHILPVRVYYEDTDFGGGVYHSNFLKFCERGRSDFLRLLGLFHSDLQTGKYGDKQIGFAVRHIESDFLKPAGIDDLLEVRTKFLEAKGARLVLKQDVILESAFLYRAKITVAVIDGEGRPTRMPDEMRSALLRWQEAS